MASIDPPDSPDPNSCDVGDRAGEPGYPRGMGRRLSVLAAVVALALAGGFAFVWSQRATTAARLAQETKSLEVEAPRVDIVAAQLAPPAQRLVLPGETAAWNETTIFARVNGYVANWLVDIGDHVKDGQILATIDTPELDAELVAAKARLNASEAQVLVKQARAEFARTTYDRWRNSPKGVVSEQERESTKASAAEAAAELAAAQAQVKLSQADVDRLSALTQFKKVAAPFDGTIIERRINLGDLVTAGSTASTSPLYRISQDKPMRIFVSAPQSAAEQLLRPGGSALIAASSHSGLRLEGKVARTAQAINPEARTLRVEIDVPNSHRELIPGMYVQVTFDLDNEGLIQVPAAALLFRPGGPQVAVIDNEGRIAFKHVTIDRDYGDVVDIGSGLAVGDKIALNLNSQIVAGQKVQINDLNQGKARVSSTH